MATKKPTKPVAAKAAPAPLKQLSVNLENCYGIRKFKEVLTFESDKPVVIYAPNGAMKTSLSKTFLDLSNDQMSTDRIFKKRTTLREIRVFVPASG